MKSICAKECRQTTIMTNFGPVLPEFSPLFMIRDALEKPESPICIYIMITIKCELHQLIILLGTPSESEISSPVIIVLQSQLAQLPVKCGLVLLNLLPGQLVELCVDVDHLEAGQDRLVALVDLLATVQDGGQLIIRRHCNFN